MEVKQVSDIRIPENIRELKAYVPGKTIAEVVAEYQPKRIAKLASNENRLGCSSKALEAASKSFATINNYPDSLSTELRKKIAERNGVDISNVVCGGGSEALIHQIMRTFCEEGDEALCVNATFVGFFVAAKIRNVPINFVPLTPGYQYDLKLLADSITSRTRVIYLANPNNPTGTYFTASQFEYLMARVPDHVLVIMDEAYLEFAKNIAPQYPDTLSYKYKNVIVLRTFSKAYGLAGFRVGYGIADESLVAPMLKTKLTFDPAAPAQAAALGALDDDPFIDDTITSVTKGRDDLYRIFEKYNLKYIKSYANSVMLHFDMEEKAIFLTEEFLKRGVIVRRLPGFGLPSCVRISTGLEEDHQQIEQALSEIFNQN